MTSTSDSVIDVNADHELQQMFPKELLKIRPSRLPRFVAQPGVSTRAVCSHLDVDGHLHVQPLLIADCLNQSQILINYYMTELKHQLPDHPLSRRCPDIVQRRLTASQLAEATNVVIDDDNDSSTWCIALHPTTQCFYRARIIERVAAHQVQLEFLDYGDRCRQHICHLYHMPDEFRRLPPCAIRCRLPDHHRRLVFVDQDSWRSAVEGMCMDVVFESLDESTNALIVSLKNEEGNDVMETVKSQQTGGRRAR